MDKTFMGKMETSLKEIKKSILATLAAESEDFKEAKEDVGLRDDADIASNDYDVRMIEAVGSHDMKRLEMVEAAIGRIHNERFGVCAKCGKKIDEDRLEAIPYAPFCIKCQSSSERRRH